MRFHGRGLRAAAAALAIDAGELPLASEPWGEAEPPPPAIGQDDRRMQLRAYELWTRLLGPRELPAIADLRPGEHPQISPFGVLLDFTGEPGDPRVAFLGESLAAECGIEPSFAERVSTLPERSLLARIAEHYLRTVLRPEPIGFEAEFVNQRGRTIMYRGILLPFTREGRMVDYVFAVISWKELAEPATVAGLLDELERALQEGDFGGGPGGNFAEDRCLPADPATQGDGGAPGCGQDSPAIDAAARSDLAAIEGAPGGFALLAIGRSACGQPIVLGEVKRGSPLFALAAAHLSA